VTVLELANIRCELHSALAVLAAERTDGQAASSSGRMIAVDHVRTALLLLNGSTSATIVGHLPGSVHSHLNQS
jgi:hypothetical protein